MKYLFFAIFSKNVFFSKKNAYNKASLKRNLLIILLISTAFQINVDASIWIFRFYLFGSVFLTESCNSFCPCLTATSLFLKRPENFDLFTESLTLRERRRTYEKIIYFMFFFQKSHFSKKKEHVSKHLSNYDAQWTVKLVTQRPTLRVESKI